MIHIRGTFCIVYPHAGMNDPVVDSVCNGTYICAYLICVAFIGMTPVPSAASASLPEVLFLLHRTSHLIILSTTMENKVCML